MIFTSGPRTARVDTLPGSDARQGSVGARSFVQLCFVLSSRIIAAVGVMGILCLTMAASYETRLEDNLALA